MPAALIERVAAGGAAAGGDHGHGAHRRPHQRADGAHRHDGGGRHDAGAHQRPGHGVAGSGACRRCRPPASRPGRRRWCAWRHCPARPCAARWPRCCRRSTPRRARCACASSCPTRASGCAPACSRRSRCRARPRARRWCCRAEAVIRTGRRALVYVQDAPGRYRPVEVELGPEVGGQVVIRSGIAAGQQVVASGQFLIDSEASLQGVMARARAGGRRGDGVPGDRRRGGAGPGQHHARPRAGAGAQVAGDDDALPVGEARTGAGPEARRPRGVQFPAGKATSTSSRASSAPRRRRRPSCAPRPSHAAAAPAVDHSSHTGGKP